MPAKSVSRREFLRVSALATTGAITAACTIETGTAVPTASVYATATTAPAQATNTPAPTPTTAPAKEMYGQSPMLADLVASGDIPPIEDRLPSEPLVLEPVEEIGEYGGTWRRSGGDDGIGRHKMATYIEPFTKRTRDLAAERPNVITAWEFNDALTEVTLYFRKGIKWSDGVPLTVDDYVFWWNDMALDESVDVSVPPECKPGGNNMEMLKVDDFTVKLTFSEPNAFFIEFSGIAYSRSSYYLAPSHYLKQFHPTYETSKEDTEAVFDRYLSRQMYPDMPTHIAWRPAEFVSGQQATFVRNPYYWKTDTEGNQLPYIDGIELILNEDEQVRLQRAISGELDAQFRNFAIKDVPLLKENEEEGDYRVIMWDRGNIAWPWLILQYTAQDEGWVDLLYTKEFVRALSVAMNRERMNDITVFGLATPSQPAMIPSNPEYTLPGGREVYENWRDSFVEYDFDQAKAWLDEVGVVDASGDGWRDRPDGTELEIILDVSVGDQLSSGMLDLIKEDWEAVGLKTTINPLEWSVMDDRGFVGECMIRAWGSAGSDWLFTAPPVWTPIYNTTWSIGGPGLGLYYETGGEDGIAPRPDSALDKLQKIYTQAKTLTDVEARFKKVLEGYQVHIDEGPVSIGTLALHPSPCVVKNNVRNVQDFGITALWDLGFAGTADPEQFFFKTG